MMPAAKHGDPQLGVDVHLCVVPPSPSPVPLPTPHMSVVFDPMDYLPFIGATVTVGGMKRAVAGTAGQAVHIPPGFPFAPKLPDKDDEIFMGSATVEADGDPFSFLGVPVLACQAVGMPSPPRPRRKGGPRIMMLPTVFNLAIPTNVFVGGPPTISLMGMAFKAGLAGLGKLARSNFARAVGARFQAWRKAKFGHLNAGFLKCTILRAEPVNIVTGAVSVEQQDFALPGLIALRWTRRYASDNARRGACGVGWTCPADARLGHDAESGVVLFHHPEEGIAIFPALPAAEGDAAAVLELMDGALLSDHGTEFRVRTKEDRIYRFPKSLGFDAGNGEREYPLWQVRDLCGNTLTWEREGGNLVALVDSAGRRIELETGPDGLLRQASLHVPENGFRHSHVRYEQDAGGDLLAVVDALGNPYRFAYDRHHMVRHTDRNGLSFHYEFDRSGEAWRVVRSWGDGGLYAYKFAYLDAVNERKITDSLGHVSLVKLDERGLPISEIDPLGGITVYEYDDAGRTTAVVDQDGHRTEYAFDERGNLLKTTRPDGRTIETAFSSANKALTITDPNGASWQQRWDARGLLREIVTRTGHLYRYDYDGRGQLTAFTDPRGSRTTLTYDVAGNLVALTDALGHSTSFSYDARGQVTRKRDPLGSETAYRYDAVGRLVEGRMPSGARIACAYDAEGNLTRYLDANGAETRLGYFGVGQIARRILPDGHQIAYQYDTEERLVAVVNQRGEAYRMRRDALGRVVAEEDYWGQVREYRLSRCGYLLETTDPLGTIVIFRNDTLGQVLEKVTSNPGQPGMKQTETFEYDANGNLIACANAAVRIDRRFDADGRLVEEKQGDACTVTNAYDAAGNRISRTTSREVAGRTHALTVRYGYDALDQAVRIEAEGCQSIELSRNPIGQLTSERMGQLVQRQSIFNADGFLTAQRLRIADHVLLEQAYSYDQAGNPLAKRDSASGVERYEYDPVGRLIARLDPQGRLTPYPTDAAGDKLITRLISADPKADERSTWRREGEYDGTQYRFDRAGNLIERAGSDGVTLFAWDGQQRLTASSSHGRTISYVYDPLGRRVRKLTGETAVHFCWDGDFLLGEAVVASSSDADPVVRLVREWVAYPGTFEPLGMAECPGDGSGGNRAWDWYLFHNDPNGCPTRLLGATGEIVWAASYGGWGRLEQQTANRVDNPIRLQGQYEDPETGLHYNRFRYYDPAVGQYISIDPLGLDGGIQLYISLPNVLAWIDPLGLDCQLPKALKKQYRKIEDLAQTPGNKGIPAALNPRELRKLGEEFVGEGHSVVRGARHGELWLISADGKRLFRAPTPKSSPYARTGKQANFHQRNNINHNWFDDGIVSNVHVHSH